MVLFTGLVVVVVFIKALKNEPIANLEKEEKQFGLMWAKKKGYIDIKDGRLVPLKEEKQVQEENNKLINVLGEMRLTGKCKDQKVYEELAQRKLIEKTVQKE